MLDQGEPQTASPRWFFSPHSYDHNARTRPSSWPRPGSLCISSKQSGGEPQSAGASESRSGSACFMNESSSTAPQVEPISSLQPDARVGAHTGRGALEEPAADQAGQPPLPYWHYMIVPSRRDPLNRARYGESRRQWAGIGA